MKKLLAVLAVIALINCFSSAEKDNLNIESPNKATKEEIMRANPLVSARFYSSGYSGTLAMSPKHCFATSLLPD